MPPTTQINIRRDTAAAFTAANPTLAFGEIAYETDTFRFKVGTGSTAWTALGYAAQNPTTLTVGENAVINGYTVGKPANVGVSNVIIGSAAGDLLGTTSFGNVAIGNNVMRSTGNVVNNVVIGVNSLAEISHGSQNVVIGSDAARFVTGSANNAIGRRALYGNGSAAAVSNSLAIGDRALEANRVSNMVALGHEALRFNTLGTANVALGTSALNAATTAIGTFTTTPVAAGSGYTANQTGVTVTLVKKSGADTFTGTVQAALTTNASGAVTAVQAAPVSAGSTFTGSNVIFEPSGFGAGSGCEIGIATLATASSNTAVGHQAGLSLTIGGSCTLVGANAGDAITSAPAATAVGTNALGSLTTGTLNTAVGASALQNVVTGAQNTALGWSAGLSVTSSDAVCIGTRALLNATTATQSVAVGSGAGRYRGSGTDLLTSATSSIFIGYQSRANGDSQTNQVVIAGTDGLGDGSNTTVIGSTATTQARLQGGTFLSTGANGQSTQLGQSTTLLSGLTGATVTATNLIPANSILLGVTARVTTAITGATTFDIGDGVTADRFGNDVAIALNTTSQNAIAPALFAAANNVVLTANGANFTGGAVRLTAHFITLVAPTS